MIHLSEWGFHTARIACLEWLPGLGGQKYLKKIDIEENRTEMIEDSEVKLSTYGQMQQEAKRAER